MKAEITESGQLLVIPENGAEAWGLEAWCDRFLKITGYIGFILEVPDPDDNGKIHPGARLKTGEVRESS